MANNQTATTPGGSSSTMSEGPLRPGLVPRRIEFPFKPPPFHADMLGQVSRRNLPEVKTAVEIHVRQKHSILAGGHGVMTIFSKRH